MQRVGRRAVRHLWLGTLIVALLTAVGVASRAQPASEDATVLAADTSLGDAMRAGDKSVARRLLSLQFTYADENGKIYDRKAFLADLKSVAPAAATDVKVTIYGLVAVATGKRKSALGGETFFIDIWAKTKGAWRALTMQDVVLAAPDAPRPEPVPPSAETKPYECKNPCETIPYRVRSPAEQDIVTAFQAIEKATIAHDAEAWAKHIAEEFVHYQSGRAPLAKSADIATIAREKKSNAPLRVSEIETMRLSAYGDGAAMIATHSSPDSARPPFRSASVWVKRNGQWQLAIDVQTDIKPPPQ